MHQTVVVLGLTLKIVWKLLNVNIKKTALRFFGGHKIFLGGHNLIFITLIVAH